MHRQCHRDDKEMRGDSVGKYLTQDRGVEGS